MEIKQTAQNSRFDHQLEDNCKHMAPYRISQDLKTQKRV